MNSHVVYESESGLRWAVNRQTGALLFGANVLPGDIALSAMMSQSSDILIDDQLMLPIDAVLDAVSDAELKQGIQNKALQILERYRNEEAPAINRGSSEQDEDESNEFTTK